MTGTSVRDDDWGSATHWSGGRPHATKAGHAAKAPVVVAEAALWGDDHPAGDAGDEARWGATTIVGTPHGSGRRGRDNGPPAGPAANEPAASEPAASEPAASEPAASEPAASEPAAGDHGEDDRAVLAASRSMAVASLASRVTGFVRSILLVAALGAGSVGNAYNSGNNLPNMVYELLLGGVLSSVLIPLLVQAETEDDDGGVAYTQRLLSIAVTALAGMTLVVTALAPWIAAAFVKPGPGRDLTATFATLLLPEIFFYGLGAILMAILNIRHVYGPGAWAPLLNNVVVIATVGVFWLLPGPTTLNPSTMTTAQVLVVGIGTTLGIAAQALVLIPALQRSGFRWAWRFRSRPGEGDRLRQMGTLAGWVLGYVVVSQIGVSVIQRVGNINGGFTVFTNADLLFQMPYGILVVSVLTAIMPRLSRAAVRDDHAAVVDDLALGARLSAVALLPITAGLIVLGPVMGVTLFAHGQAPIERARLIGSALEWSAFGLFPFALVMLQLRVFYAMRDGRTPTIINAFMVATKVALVLATNALLAPPPGTNVDLHPPHRAIEWLNISTSVSYVVGAVVGHVLLVRRLGHLGFAQVLRTAVQIGAASACGALAAWGAVYGARQVLGDGRGGAAAGLVLGAVAGLLVLAAMLWRMRSADLRLVIGAVRR